MVQNRLWLLGADKVLAETTQTVLAIAESQTQPLERDKLQLGCPLNQGQAPSGFVRYSCYSH